MKFANVLAATVLVAASVIAVEANGVTIDVTKFQQRYPWNGLVDIDYMIVRDQGESALDPAKHNVRISVVNCGVTPAATNIAHVFRQGALPVSDGAHRVTWDANAEGINFKAQNVKVFAEVVHYAEKYMVIDVSGGPNTNCYPVTYLHGAPEGGFNRDEDKDEYKGNKIVLRLIPPGSFVMGSPINEPGRSKTADREVQHAVAITKPFYIGVFEITQKQYLNVMGGSNPSQYKADYHPVEMVKYDDIRGTANTGTHQYDWPWTNEVDATSFMGKLRAKCKECDGAGYTKDVAGLLDLPTDAQLEYACRAGTTTPFSNGEPCANDGDLDTQLKKLGAYKGNMNKHVEVGTYASNAWGLYDMHGNVWELCLDWYQADVQNIDNPSLDPVGPSAGAAANPLRVRRGGGWDETSSYCRSAYRNASAPSTGLNDAGFRLSMTLP